MCVLAHVFEAAGLATVGLSLVRRQAENAAAPRILHCEFPLGRPLGRPGDAEFQHEVLRRAFGLLPRTDVPILEDHPEVIEDESGEAAFCPLPPRFDPDLAPALDEVNGLRAAYDRNLAATGRTLVGRVSGPDGIGDLVATLLRISEGASLDDVGWDTPTLLAAGQDVRAYYEEAGAQLADVTGARQIETWLYQTTETGKVIRTARESLKASGAEQGTWYYLTPGTQS